MNMLDFSKFQPSKLKLQGYEINWQEPVIMAVVNVTPDSFFDGGEHDTFERAVDFAVKSAKAGAHILDVGGESTRPGSLPVSYEEEIKRTLPVVEELASRNYLVSIDTMKHQVAEAALTVGAGIVNDVSGGVFDPDIFNVTADYGAAIVLVHMRNMPQNMQKNINFKDVLKEVTEELQKSVEKALKVGIPKHKIIIDPGIGFGKTAEQSVLLMSKAGEISKNLGFPVLVGPSNKSFIGKLTGASVENRLSGTAISCVLAWLSGSHIFRVHQVAEIKQAFTIADKMIEYL